MAKAKKKRSRGGDAKMFARSLSSEQAVLERDAAFDESPAFSGREGTTRCYNPACPDYRRDRRIGEPCGCKKTAIGGSGSAFPERL